MKPKSSNYRDSPAEGGCDPREESLCRARLPEAFDPLVFSNAAIRINYEVIFTFIILFYLIFIFLRRSHSMSPSTTFTHAI